MGGNAVPQALMAFIIDTSSPLSPEVSDPICLLSFSAAMLTGFWTVVHLV